MIPKISCKCTFTKAQLMSSILSRFDRRRHQLMMGCAIWQRVMCICQPVGEIRRLTGAPYLLYSLFGFLMKRCSAQSASSAFLVHRRWRYWRSQQLFCGLQRGHVHLELIGLNHRRLVRPVWLLTRDFTCPQAGVTYNVRCVIMRSQPGKITVFS